MHFFNTSAGRLVLLSIGVAAISTAAPLIKLIPEVPSVLVAASRLGFASLILLPLGWRHRHAVGRQQPALVLAAGLCLALHFVSWIASLRYTSVASSVILVTLTPLLLVPAGYLMWGERPTRRLGLGIGLAIGGSVCIAWNDFQLSPPQALYGDLLALGGAVRRAAYLVCGRLVRPSVPLPLYAGLVYACAAVCLWAVCLLSPVPVLGYAGSAYLILLLLGLGPQLIGHTVVNWALAYLSPTIVAVILLAEPIGASLLAWLWLGESVSWLQGGGGALILTGIGLVNVQAQSAAAPR